MHAFLHKDQISLGKLDSFSWVPFNSFGKLANEENMGVVIWIKNSNSLWYSGWQSLTLKINSEWLGHRNCFANWKLKALSVTKLDIYDVFTTKKPFLLHGKNFPKHSNALFVQLRSGHENSRFFRKVHRLCNCSRHTITVWFPMLVNSTKSILPDPLGVLDLPWCCYLEHLQVSDRHTDDSHSFFLLLQNPLCQIPLFHPVWIEPLFLPFMIGINK